MDTLLQDLLLQDLLFKIDWQQLLLPHKSIAELILRGTLVYLVLVGILRVVPSRQLGALASPTCLWLC